MRTALEDRDELIRKDEREKIFKLLKPFEWSGLHTDYEDSWAVMTRACPFCMNAKKDGHKPSCLLLSLKGDEHSRPISGDRDKIICNPIRHNDAC